MNSLKPSPALKARAELELRRRRRAALKDRCERDFLFFCETFFREREGLDFKINAHHVLISQALLRVYRGETKRLMINMPPGYTKTELAVINFIAWCLLPCNAPNSRFLHVTYSDELATQNSKTARDIVGSEAYQRLWPSPLRKDDNAAGRWRTEGNGFVYAVSAGGQITGFRAGRMAPGFTGALIIDDPIKPEDAESEVKRRAVNQWLDRTLRSRLATPETPIILIMQRLHDDDPCGYLSSLDNGEQWEVLSLPILSDDGRPLWEYKHSLEDIEVLRRSNSRVFWTQYMQKPVPDDGEYFTRDKFKWYTKLPKSLTYYGAGDYAVSEGKGDFTELGIFGVSESGDVYIADWWGGQTKADVWIERQLDLVEDWDAMMWAGETGPIKAAIEPWLERRMNDRKVFTNLRWLNHGRADKTSNARSFQALVEAGKVHLPKGQKWAEELLNQLLRFPAGKYDDKVDTCSLFARMINDVWSSGRRIQKEQPETPKGLTLNELMKLNGKRTYG